MTLVASRRMQIVLITANVVPVSVTAARVSSACPRVQIVKPVSSAAQTSVVLLQTHAVWPMTPPVTTMMNAARGCVTEAYVPVAYHRRLPVLIPRIVVEMQPVIPAAPVV